MAMFTTGLADALLMDTPDDAVVTTPARWMDDLLGGLEGAQDRMTSLRLASGFEAPLLASVSEETVDEAFFFQASGAFTLDHRNDDFLLSGLDHGIGGDWNDFAVSAGHRASHGFESPAVQARHVVGFDGDFPGTVVDRPAPEVWPGASTDDLLLAKDADLPTVLPAAEDFDYTVTRMSDGAPPSRWTSHMLTFLEDGAVFGPAQDDDFVLAKDADLPTVLPAAEDFDYTVTRMSDGEPPSRWTSDMLTFNEDGAVPGLTDDLGRPHGHDDWLF
jgi:hypothetical protein